uniref:Uncharacterized protein n=1 Tax=Rhizophora mucronata TaxID=61149 RepID=A0A2P2P0Z8_RHIMU
MSTKPTCLAVGLVDHKNKGLWYFLQILTKCGF